MRENKRIEQFRQKEMARLAPGHSIPSIVSGDQNL
jgi:hypothetical protein